MKPDPDRCRCSCNCGRKGAEIRGVRGPFRLALCKECSEGNHKTRKLGIPQALKTKLKHKIKLVMSHKPAAFSIYATAGLLATVVLMVRAATTVIFTQTVPSLSVGSSVGGTPVPVSGTVLFLPYFTIAIISVTICSALLIYRYMKNREMRSIR